jgi:hypothetical protein
MSGGRTNGRMTFKKRFSAFFESYPRFLISAFYPEGENADMVQKRSSAFFESYPRFILSSVRPPPIRPSVRPPSIHPSVRIRVLS